MLGQSLFRQARDTESWSPLQRILVLETGLSSAYRQNDKDDFEHLSVVVG